MDPSRALVIVDVQNDSVPGGRLAVPDGDRVVPVANALARRFATVVLTQDWHAPDHPPFASQHPGRAPSETAQTPYGPQVLLPDHCVMDTPGASLHPALDVPHAHCITRKGGRREVDSYSAFLEADRATHTGLDGYLRSRGVRGVVVCGLATDYGVAWTALDARRFGFEAAVAEEACRAIDLGGSLARAWAEMDGAGVRRVSNSSRG